jgi:Zn-dependent peptidase ImmA (M78 family)/transcriptional regulator with XRE-family HTH domain
MPENFDGGNVRLARLFHGFSLDDVAQRVGKTRQFIHKIESGQAIPGGDLADHLADALQVSAGFFHVAHAAPIAEESVHFRKLVSTKSMVKQIAVAKAEMLRRVVDVLDDLLELPPVNFRELPDAATASDIERAAETARSEWELGSGPIANMTRLAEHAGAVVTTFAGVSPQVDALSVPLKRPIIVRNEAKESACRMRFDIGHEIGHLVLHVGRTTGDRVSEQQANRYASALLLPRTMMAKFFPRPRHGRLDWAGLSEFKLTWKASKAAVLYRAHQLGLIDENQYRTGFITLKRTGEAVHEREDSQIPQEQPELMQSSLHILQEQAGMSLHALAERLCVSDKLLQTLLQLPEPPAAESENVVPRPRPSKVLLFPGPEHRPAGAFGQKR